MIFLTLLTMIVIMAGAWVTQRVTNNIGWVDVVWTFGTGVVGIIVALVAGQGPASAWRSLMVAAMIALWAIRLGYHIAIRVLHGEEDSRYQVIRAEWGTSLQTRLFGFLQVQALVSMILFWAVASAAGRAAGPFGVSDALGLVIWAVAVMGERTADRQLAAFRADPANRGGICDVGLWAWSRHPNFFFEWLGWFAYPVIATKDGAVAWGALLAPLVMYLVLVHGTGIPPIETQMARSRGAAFEAYRRRTSAFFPMPPKSAPLQETGL